VLGSGYVECKLLFFSFQCFDTDGWVSERASGMYETGCWFVQGGDLIGALRLIAPVVTTTSIILSYNKAG